MSRTLTRTLAPAERPVTLVDSSVVLDIVTDDPAWAEWSAERPSPRRGMTACW